MTKLREPIEYLLLIDRMYEKYKGKIRRVDLKWGEWSAPMNRQIRKAIENHHPKMDKYGLIFKYWILISELIDLMYTWEHSFMWKIVGQFKIKNHLEQIKFVRGEIMK